MEYEIVPADKKHRSLARITAVLLTILGLLALGLLYGHLGKIEKRAEENPRAAEEAEQQVLRLAATALWVGGLSLVGMGAWFWRLGRRINRAGRFPPPGMKVIRDTRVRTGAEARTLANLAQAATLLCIVAGTVGMWYFYRLAAAVLQR